MLQQPNCAPALPHNLGMLPPSWQYLQHSSQPRQMETRRNAAIYLQRRTIDDEIATRDSLAAHVHNHCRPKNTGAGLEKQAPLPSATATRTCRSRLSTTDRPHHFGRRRARDHATDAGALVTRQWCKPGQCQPLLVGRTVSISVLSISLVICMLCGRCNQELEQQPCC